MTLFGLVTALLSCAPAPEVSALDAEVEAKACELQSWYADADGDGYGDPADVVDSTLCRYPNRVTNDSDCDDTDSAVYPRAKEICDGIDNDCDGKIDSADNRLAGGPSLNYFADTDGDGYGDPGALRRACSAPPRHVDNYEDCDDTDAAVNPDATEVCDGVDNDCNKWVDGSDPGLDGGDTYYIDHDGDGYGSSGFVRTACSAPSGFADNNDDCNDLDADANPDGVEVCDGADNDCDGTTDVGLKLTFYADTDGDGAGDASTSVTDCDAPTGYTGNAVDCDDTDPSGSPWAHEICDGIDNDCDGSADGSDAVDVDTFYGDADGDGFGNADSPQEACEAPANTVDDDTDCDDTDSAVNPDATEVCDSVDNDCDGETDEDSAADATTWVIDYDGDGYGAEDGAFSTVACSAPSGWVDDTSDCDDGDATVSPGATDTCGDGVDSDCDGVGGPDGDEDGDGSTWTEEQAAGTDDCDAGSTVDCATVDTTTVVIFSAEDADTLCDCTTTAGEVYVNATGTTPVDLSCLTSVTGALEIENSDATSIDLSSLTAVGDELYVHENSTLDSIDLGALETVGSYLYVQSNDALTTLSLPSLQDVSGQVYVYDNQALTSLTLTSLSSVRSSFYVYYNNALTELSLPALTEIRGELFLYYNAALASASFDALTTVMSSVQIEENYLLDTLEMPVLSRVESSFYLRYNYELDTVTLTALSDVLGSMYWQYNYEIDTLDLSALESVSSDFYFYYQSDLATLSLPSLTDVGGTLTVSYCDVLTELSAPALSYLGGNLVLQDDPSLASVDVSSLTCVSDYTIEGHGLSEDDHYDLLVQIPSGC